MVPLVTSGSEITDLTRLAGLSGDGAAWPDSSFGIWPAATNLVTNGGFETNTAGWAASSNYVISRSTEQYKFGAASLKSVFPASSTGTGPAVFAITLTAAGHAGSMWVYVPSDYDGGALAVEFLNFGSPTVASTRATVNLSLRDQWQRLTVTITPAAGDLLGDFRLTIDGALPTTGRAVYVDGVQVETGSVATPYIETDGATAARSAARVQMPIAGLFTPTQGAIFARVYFPYANTALGTGNATVLTRRDAADDLIELRYNWANNQWELERSNAGTGTVHTFPDTFTAKSYVSVLAAWSPTAIFLSVDGVALTSAADTNIPTLAAAAADIGSVAGTSAHLGGVIKHLLTFTGIPTDADAALLHSYGNNKPDPRLLPPGMGVTGIWTCRDGIFRKRATA